MPSYFASASREFLADVKSKFAGFSAGGILIDEAVVAVFGALIWHTQALREDLEKALDARVAGEKIPVTEGHQQVRSKGSLSAILTGP